jgi:hypothetical protein
VLFCGDFSLVQNAVLCGHSQFGYDHIHHRRRSVGHRLRHRQLALYRSEEGQHTGKNRILKISQKNNAFRNRTIPVITSRIFLYCYYSRLHHGEFFDD